MSQPNPSNWLVPGYYSITLNGTAPAGASPAPSRVVLNLIAGAGMHITVADNPAEGPVGATDVTFSSTGGGSSGWTLAPVNGPATVHAEPFIIYECDCTGGDVVILVDQIVSAAADPTPTFNVNRVDATGNTLTVANPSTGDIMNPNNPSQMLSAPASLPAQGQSVTWYYNGTNLRIL